MTALWLATRETNPDGAGLDGEETQNDGLSLGGKGEEAGRGAERQAPWIQRFENRMQHMDKRLQTLEAELDGLDIEDIRVAQTKAKNCFHRLRDEQEEKNKALIARLEGRK